MLETVKDITSIAVLAGLLMWVSVHDWRTLRIPNIANASLALAGAVACAVLGLDAADRLIGGLAGYGVLAGLGWAYWRLRGRDGLGLGDAKLLGAGGVWIGWIGLPFALLIAASAGLCAVAALRLGGRILTATDKIAFGPFLALGIFVVWLAQRFAV